MTQEALKLVLEWAEANGEIVFAGGGMDAVNKMNSWVTAIKEALKEHAMREVQRLEQKIEQEPVKYSDYEPDGVHHTTPPQRTWVDLTDEEENEYNYLGPDMHWVIQEIAAKLKEKNT
jgi:hypothetical protein